MKKSLTNCSRTIDALGSYIKEFSQDIDGNGVLEEGDIFSMNLSRGYMDAQVFGSGVVFMNRGDNGYPILNLEDPMITTVMEKIISNYVEPKTTFDFAAVRNQSNEYFTDQRTAFAERKLLFLNDYLIAIYELRDMDDDYGILPILKLDESIDRYEF